MNFISVIKNNSALIEALVPALTLGLLSNYVLHRLVKKYNYPANITLLKVVISAFVRAFYFIFPLIYFSFFAWLFNLPKTAHFVEVSIKILITLALSLSAIKLLDYVDIWLERKKNSQTASQNLGIFITRAYLLKKILSIIIILLALALVLLNFPVVKEIGKGILISAGVIGGIMAFAAQKILANIFSGLDFILNKPIKVGDLINIGPELGKIEKITLNQIHMRTWDLRLIIYPLSYFIENSFQNLSHAEYGLRGVVVFYMDYSVDVEKLREYLADILRNSPLWDEKTGTLEMIEVTETTVQLRAVVSARNSGDLWNLRCQVREKMIKLIQKNSPGILPKGWVTLTRNSNAEKISPRRVIA